MIVRFYQGWFQVLTIDLPLFLASTCSISSFYLAAERAFYPKTWKRTFWFLPFVMALGVGIAVRNAFAVIEALVGKKSEFVRTPKYKVEADGKNRNAWLKKSYRKSAGVMPYIEIGLGCYFTAAVVYSVQMENYATVPFMLLFVWGYFYTGVMSLAQPQIDRLTTLTKEGLSSISTRTSTVLGLSRNVAPDALVLAPAEGDLIALNEPPAHNAAADPATSPAPKARTASAGS